MGDGGRGLEEVFASVKVGSASVGVDQCAIPMISPVVE